MTTRALRIMEMIRESYRDSGYAPHYPHASHYGPPAQEKRSGKGALIAAGVGGALLYNALPKKRLGSAGNAAAKDWMRTGAEKEATHTPPVQASAPAVHTPAPTPAPQAASVPASAPAPKREPFKMPTQTTAEMEAARDKSNVTTLPAGTKPTRPNAYIMQGSAATSPDDYGAGERVAAQAKTTAATAHIKRLQNLMKQQRKDGTQAKEDVTPKPAATPKAAAKTPASPRGAGEGADRADGEGGYTIMRGAPKKMSVTTPEAPRVFKSHGNGLDDMDRA